VPEAARYDAIVIGAGLGGLTAATLLAQAGRKTLLIERNSSVGGAASTYRVGDLVVEASLHATSDPVAAVDPKHFILRRIGVLDSVQWVPTGSLYEVRGGPVGEPFTLADDFATARAGLLERFPTAKSGIAAVLADMEKIAVSLGTLSRRREAFRDPREGFGALVNLAPVVRDWRRSVTEVFDRAFGANESVKCALAANLGYWHDDPDELWWVLFAVAQGGYLASGGRYVRGGSARLSQALANAFTSAGGEILLSRKLTGILLDGQGHASGVVHQAPEGADAAEALAPILIANAAPASIAAMLPVAAREHFGSAYARQRLSISLFAATFGLSVRPATLGFRRYATFLMPSWMHSLRDQRRSAQLLGEKPGQGDPALSIVDYSAIDSGLGGPPYPVSVVGVDRVSNWSGLDKTAYATKRDLWQQAVVEIIDRQFPGFASQIVASVFNTAVSLQNYLGTPEGAVYGFAPLPPSGPIWRGPGRSVLTPVHGLYLASSFAGSGGFTGAIRAGADCAQRILGTLREH